MDFSSSMCLEGVRRCGNNDHWVCSHSGTVYVVDGPRLIYFVGATTAPPAVRLCLRLAINMLQF